MITFWTILGKRREQMKSIAMGLVVSLVMLGGSSFAAQKQQTITVK